MKAVFKKHWLFLIILATGLFLRIYKPLSFYMYGHDQDLAGWIVKDILVNKHLRLIGQETTSQGIFIGPLFYYLQIPFYLISKMDPVGTLLLPIILSVFAIFSFYFVFSKIFNRQTGLLASFIYATSSLIVFLDRETVPTMPVMLWTVWYLYSLFLLHKGNNKAYLLTGFLLGLIWNLNLALILVSPLVLLVIILSRKKISLKYALGGMIILIFILSLFFVFEVRHNYQQSKAIISSLMTSKDYVPGTSVGWVKFDRVMQLVRRDTTDLVWDSVFYVPAAWTFYLLFFVFVFLSLKRIIPFYLSAVSFFWVILYLAFFSFSSLNPSEYYFNGMNVIWIMLIACFWSYLLKQKGKWRPIGIGFLCIFALVNLIGFFKKPINASGYLQRKALIDFVYNDAKEKGYPCVSVSYITAPGYERGYRYLFWLKKLHVNAPSSGSPVYSIVFPHSKVDRLDKSFGALGLVLPDYDRYNKVQVEKSCSGLNSNLTDPMPGYTE